MKDQRYTTYNLEEAAQLTGYAQVTLRRAIDEGELAVTEKDQGGEIRISGVELERWWHGVEGQDASLFVEEYS